MLHKNLSVCARAFYSDLMSGLITRDLKEKSELRFLNSDIQNLHLDYDYNNISLKTEFKVDESQKCIQVTTSRIDLDPSTSKISLCPSPSLHLTYKSGHMLFQNPFGRVEAKFSLDLTKNFTVTLNEVSGFFSQTYLSAITLIMSDVEV
ncbi:MAG TPA: hypothetical protein VGO45_00010 [Bacteroidia bacterium]|nr:hypothetical protein [Bacteroidia bacterium]